MKVLVTGGLGFIGSHTVDALLAKGHSVRILDNLQHRVHPRGIPPYAQPDAEIVVGDVASRTDLDNALRGIDAVMHLAAYQDYLPEFSRFIHANAESAALLFELIVERRYPIQKMLFASSQSVAGEGRYQCELHGEIVPELRSVDQLQRGDWEIHCPQCGRYMEWRLIDESVTRPHTAYGISKYAIEMLAESLGRRYGIPTVCMRYTYVQGARNSFFNAYSGICRTFALRILNGKAPVCYEDGKQLRDYVNVKDVARANLVAMETLAADHLVLNVGGGRPLSVLEFAGIILSACNSQLEPQLPGLFRVGDTRHTISDIAAMRAIGWEPTIPVEQSVNEYLEWMGSYKDTRAYLDDAERVMQLHGVVRPVVMAT